MTNPCSSTITTTSTTLDIRQILALLPHRYPFLLVDQVLEMNAEAKTILAKKAVTFNEPFFQGHFPNLPVMPGVLILEALAQTSGIYLAHMGHTKPGKVMVLLTMREVKFRHPVRPGDTLLLHSHILQASSRAGRVETVARVNDTIVTEAQMAFAMADPDQL